MLDNNIDSIALELIDEKDKEFIPDKGSMLKFRAMMKAIISENVSVGSN